MIECITQQSSITFRWTFNRMLAAIPVPNTTAFASLCRGLQPFGIAPSRVSLEAPSSWLGDVELRILLLDAERATLRISYNAFEVNIRYLSSGDDDALENMLRTVFAVLGEIDSDSRVGQSQLVLNAHMSFKTHRVEEFLRDHLCGGERNDSLTPDLFYYRVRLDQGSEVQEMRIGVTRSLLFENSLFVECTGEYAVPDEPESIGKRFAKDCANCFTLLDLSPKSVPKAEGNS